MSVLIKGQELPISCGDCMMLFLTEGRNKCPFLWRCFGDNNDYQNKKRMPDCPLVEVSEPHGRLIEAPEITWQKDLGEVNVGALITIAQKIDDAPTVIEAEEQEHE